MARAQGVNATHKHNPRLKSSFLAAQMQGIRTAALADNDSVVKTISPGSVLKPAENASQNPVIPHHNNDQHKPVLCTRYWGLL